jgi:hypothetical protein
MARHDARYSGKRLAHERGIPENILRQVCRSGESSDTLGLGRDARTTVSRRADAMRGDSIP